MGIGIGAALLGGAAISAGGGIFSSIFGAKGAAAQAAATREAAKIAGDTAITLDTKARKDLAPFREMGLQAGKSLLDIMSGKKTLDLAGTGSSLYRYQSDLGMRDITRQLAARGLQGSGAGMETLARFTNQLTAEEGQRFYDRMYNLTTLGSNAAARMATNTMQTGNNLAGIQGQLGVANAQAIGAQYNALGQGIGNTFSGIGGTIAQIPMYNASLNMLNRMGAGAGGATMSLPAIPSASTMYGAAPSMQAMRLGLTGF